MKGTCTNGGEKNAMEFRGRFTRDRHGKRKTRRRKDERIGSENAGGFRRRGRIGKPDDLGKRKGHTAHPSILDGDPESWDR
eukprot:gene15680-657_t